MFDTPISRQIIVRIQTVSEFRKCLTVTGLEEYIQMLFCGTHKFELFVRAIFRTYGHGVSQKFEVVLCL